MTQQIQYTSILQFVDFYFIVKIKMMISSKYSKSKINKQNVFKCKLNCIISHNGYNKY